MVLNPVSTSVLGAVLEDGPTFAFPVPTIVDLTARVEVASAHTNDGTYAFSIPGSVVAAAPTSSGIGTNATSSAFASASSAVPAAESSLTGNEPQNAHQHGETIAQPDARNNILRILAKLMSSPRRVVTTPMR